MFEIKLPCFERMVEKVLECKLKAVRDLLSKLPDDETGWLRYYRAHICVDWDKNRGGMVIGLKPKSIKVREIKYGYLAFELGGAYYKPSQIRKIDLQKAQAVPISADEFARLDHPEFSEVKDTDIGCVNLRKLSLSVEYGLNDLKSFKHIRIIKEILQ